MRILLIAGTVPYRRDGELGVTAAHIVARAMIDELMKRGHALSLVCLFPVSRPAIALTASEQHEFDDLRRSGVQVLEPIWLSTKAASTPVRFRSLTMFLSTEAALRHYYPGYLAEQDILQRLGESRADIALPLWNSQGIAALRNIGDVTTVAYHGDIDFEPMWCRRVKDPTLFGFSGGMGESLDARLRVYEYRTAHLKLMQSPTTIANVTAAHVPYYQEHGHPRSMYVGNVWIDQGRPNFGAPRNNTTKIIGHVGYLNRTGATYGLQFLLRDVLPHLKNAMGHRPYEVHIIGGGEPVAALRPLLQQEHIVRHGFVEDLNAELDSSDVFCLFNNAGPYVAAYTRHLVAWASGLCLVTHARSSLAIPELVSGTNTLAADNGRDVADLIAKAATDTAFNKRIREAGRTTFEQTFTPSAVVTRLETVLQEAVASGR